MFILNQENRYCCNFFGSKGKLVNVRYRYTQTGDPLQAEAAALLEALQQIHTWLEIDSGQQDKKIAVYSDCKILVNATKEGSVLEAWNYHVGEQQKQWPVVQCFTNP